MAEPENSNKPPEASPPADADGAKTDIDFSAGLAGFLAAGNISLGFTSYQTGRLYLIGSTKRNIRRQWVWQATASASIWGR